MSESTGRFSVERMSSYKTDDKSLYNILSYRQFNAQCDVIGYDTHGRVYSHRLSYYISC